MRLFASIGVSSAVTDKLLPVHSALEGSNHLSIVPLAQLHCTLCFIGEADPNPVEKALAAIRFRPFRVNAVGIGAFPNLRSPRSVWVGLHSQELNSLAEKVQKALNKTEKRPFFPHCTLARARSPVDLSFLEKYSKTQFDPFNVSTFELKQSRLSVGGAEHVVLRSFQAT